MNRGILFVTEDHSTRNTGVTVVVNMLAGLARALVAEDQRVVIVCTGTDSVEPPAGVDLIELPPAGIGRAWRWSPVLKKEIRRVVRDYNVGIVHLHGVWTAAPLIGQKIARSLNVPALLTVHGMLEPWAWRGQGRLRLWKKRFYWQLFAARVFSGVTVLHAITSLEQKHLEELLPHREICMIPNAIDPAVAAVAGRENPPTQRRILFLGRIHPKKGVDRLIAAFVQVAAQTDWQLVVAGPEEDGPYLQQLHSLAGPLVKQGRVVFTGPVYDARKFDLLTGSWVVVVPSHSEVVGVVNLEAAACGTPTITTPQTGLLEWEQSGGLLVRPEVEELTDALQTVMNWEPEERARRGDRAREFVHRYYSVAAVGPRWMELYQELERRGQAMFAVE